MLEGIVAVRPPSEAGAKAQTAEQISQATAHHTTIHPESRPAESRPAHHVAAPKAAHAVVVAIMITRPPGHHTVGRRAERVLRIAVTRQYRCKSSAQSARLPRTG